MAHARTTAAIDHLLALGASAIQPDRYGATPMAALSRASEALARHLMTHGVAAAPEDLARWGDRACCVSATVADSVMMAAVGARQLSLVRWLIANGGNPNARDAGRSRQTVLHEAAWNGDLATVQFLVSAGADPALLDEEHNSTAEHWAEVAVDVRKLAACQQVADWLSRLPSR